MSYMGIMLQKEKMAHAKTLGWTIRIGAESQFSEGRQRSYLCSTIAPIAQPNLQHRRALPAFLEEWIRDGGIDRGMDKLWLEN